MKMKRIMRSIVAAFVLLLCPAAYAGEEIDAGWYIVAVNGTIDVAYVWPEIEPMIGPIMSYAGEDWKWDQETGMWKSQATEGTHKGDSLNFDDEGGVVLMDAPPPPGQGPPTAKSGVYMQAP